MLEEVFSSRPDLRDIPLSQPDETYYTDRTAYLEQGHEKTGYAVTTDAVVEAGRLPPHTARLNEQSSGRSYGVLKLAKGKKVNIYTDSWYAFATLHVPGAIYKVKGAIDCNWQRDKNKEEILLLVEAVWKPAAVAVMPCNGHQRADTPQAKGNCLADRAVKQAAV